MATTNLLTISIHEDEDPTVAMAENWGSSYFLAKTKPKTPEVLDRLAGKINQQVTQEFLPQHRDRGCFARVFGSKIGRKMA